MAVQAITRASNGTLQVPARPTIPVLEGDGIGPELWRACRPVLDAAVQKAFGKTRSVDWLVLASGEAARSATGSTLPAPTLAALSQHLVALKGPLATEPGQPSVEAELRRRLDLYACLVQVQPLPTAGTGAAAGNPTSLFIDASEGPGAEWEFPAREGRTQALLDLLRQQAPEQFLRVRFGSRERTDSYQRALGRRETPVVEVAAELRPLTRAGAQRLTGAALQWAQDHGRRTVALVHQGEAFPTTEGGWIDWAYDVGDEFYSLIEPNYLRAQSRAGLEVAEQGRRAVLEGGGLYLHSVELGEALARAVAAPEAFDVVVATAPAGLFLARTLAAASGGVGTLSARTFNAESGRAHFGPVHGSAQALAGQDRANPLGFLRAGADMLRHIGWNEAAAHVEQAAAAVLRQGLLTADLARLQPGTSAAPASLSAWTAAAARAI